MENEYPKALYRGEDTALAKDRQHEEALNLQGFGDHPSRGTTEKPVEDKPKRTRKAEPEAE